LICSEKNIPLKLWPFIVKAIAYIKNRTYSSIINMTLYKALTKTKPNISYIKILGSFTYVLEPKEIRFKPELGKLAKKANKGILVGFRSSKNFIIYILFTNQIVNSSSVNIKEDLVYNNSYIIKEDYFKLLRQDSPNYDYLKPYIFNPINNNSDNNDNNIGELPSSSSRPVVEIPSYRPTRQEESYNSSDTEDYNRKSARLKDKELISYKGLFIYNLAL
jgi:hypothetical protein